MISQRQKLRNGNTVVRTIFTEDDLLARIKVAEHILLGLDDSDKSLLGEELFRITEALKKNCVRDERYNDGKPTLTWFPKLDEDAVVFALQAMTHIENMNANYKFLNESLKEYLSIEEYITILQRAAQKRNEWVEKFLEEHSPNDNDEII